MPQKPFSKLLCHLTTPLYSFTPLNNTSSANSGQFKRNVPIGQTIEPEGKGGLISTRNDTPFLDQKRKSFLAVGFHANIQFQSKKKRPIKTCESGFL
jgi:hypothetical protein